MTRPADQQTAGRNGETTSIAEAYMQPLNPPVAQVSGPRSNRARSTENQAPDPDVAELQQSLEHERAKFAEALVEIAKLRTKVRQHEAQIARLGTIIVEKKGHQAVEDLLRELVDFGGYRCLPLRLQLAIDAANESFGWPLTIAPVS